MEEELGDEYYVDLFKEISESEPITEAIDEVCRPHTLLSRLFCICNVWEKFCPSWTNQYKVWNQPESGLN